MFEDKVLICKDCGKEWVFTATEQQFFFEKKFTNEPGRCPSCRKARKDNQAPRQLYDGAVCQTCGVAVSLPFKPSEGGKYYCREHYVRP